MTDDNALVVALANALYEYTGAQWSNVAARAILPFVHAARAEGYAAARKEQQRCPSCGCRFIRVDDVDAYLAALGGKYGADQ